MQRHTFAFAAFATLVAATPISAQATPVTVAPLRLAIYTGYLDFGYDETGEFGTPMTDLTGKSWVAQFTYDPSLGNRTTTQFYDVVQGGPSISPTFTNPILRATLEIDGVKRDFSPRYQSHVQINGTFLPSAGSLTVQSNGYGTNGSDIFQHDLYATAFTLQPLPSSLDTTFAQRNSFPVGSGLFQLYTFDSNNVLIANARGGLVPLTVELRAVPEPASWAMMIGGFALTGVALRRRARRVPA